eukprot:TRINITY_DN50008_c0_g1_i1.p1 TRINITY_DN50008_c0_g1~~TRINITY_DN50008_c0_g1_i1.p1  ORF type:complete len:400 (+),score=83.54 TRINITY_DN50008_c0_g1_i1:64-1263(+)
MIRRPPRSTLSSSSAASDVYKRQILDNGTGYLKAGLQGDEAPSVHSPSCVGLPKRLLRGKSANTALKEASSEQISIGTTALEKQGLHLNFPLDCGEVSDWDAMEIIWRHGFEDGLGLSPETDVYGTFLTEAPLNAKSTREKMTEIMFESIKTQRFYLAMQAMLALLGSGRDTGLVVDAGDGVVHTIPVYDGFSLGHAMQRQNLAGRALSEWLAELLAENRGLELRTISDLQTARRIKEDACRVSLEFESEMEREASEFPHKFELPDGSQLEIGKEAIQCPELLFTPSIRAGCEESKGLHELVMKTASECDLDARPLLLQNIVLSGGSTCFQHLPERLQLELAKLTPCKAKVVAPADRAISVWIGGSVMAGLSTFEHEWVTTAEYQEHGPRIVHKKCATL